MSAHRDVPTSTADLPTFDPLVPGFFDDPYPHYATLREQNPVHVDGRGVVFCFAYDDVRKVLIDPRSTSMERERSAPPAADGSTRSAPPTFPLAILNRDPPDHTRLRRLLGKAFTQRNLETLSGWMNGQVAQLLDDIEEQHRQGADTVDLVSALTFPFPFRVISELLGMPEGDDTQVRDWAHSISMASDPIVPKEQVLKSIAAYRAIKQYVVDEVVPWKREHPRDDLLSHLLAAEAEGSLSMEELLDNVALLYVAGHETTTGLIGNGIVNLLRHRDQLELLGRSPELLPNAIDELNRYDSSVQFAWRYVIDDLVVGDMTVPAGMMAFVSSGSANRDRGHFGERADELDIARADAKDGVSFGAGIHFCIGAHLARREAAAVIGSLFERFPDLEPAGEPEWGRRVTFRSPEQLPVTLGRKRGGRK